MYMKLLKRLILSAVAGLATALSASALEPDAYTATSVLAEGKWVKISVERSGMHLISNSQLSTWGFKNPANVRIYGFGGAMLSDVLDPADYIDDLPPIPAERVSAGLVFYAVGPTQVRVEDNALTHDVNPYDSKGYYFLTERADGELRAPEASGRALDSATGCATTGLAMLVHEQELASPGGSGRLMVGEDFNTTRQRSFTFDLTERKAGTDVDVNIAFFARTPAVASRIAAEANGVKIAESSIAATTQGEGYWGKHVTFGETIDPSGDRLTLNLAFTCGGVVNKANLDFIEITYRRTLSGSGTFFAGPGAMTLGSSDSNRRLWDITDAANPLQISLGASGSWQSDFAGMRRYVSWSVNEAGQMPQPKFAGNVTVQNLHGLTEVPDMVIVAPAAYLAAGRNIAKIHAEDSLDPLKVEVVELNQVLNEFGSGAFDPGALRRFFKMLYDRGGLRYALLLGKGTCDNRALTSTGKSVRSPMPLWVSPESLAENQSFSSDDYFALLDDFDGQRPQRETLDIAVGRIPCTTADEASTAVDKIKRYIYNQPRDDWRTRLTLLVDDENNGVHMEQAERLVASLGATDAGTRYVIQKVYCDAYERQNSTYPQAREETFDYLADGTSIFAFIGHGSPTALGSKKIIEPNDFRSRFHLKRLPFFYTATCNFLKWDYDLTSMAETLMFQGDGGIIACFAALRPVFITQNGNLSNSFGKALSTLSDGGRELTFGELYVRAKNGVNDDTNKMRYVLMGDPALRLSSPGPFVSVETINGADVTDPEAQVDLKARQTLTIVGKVLNGDGSLMSDFSGRVSATLYDAEHSVTSHGHGEGERITFEQMGDKLLSTSGSVSNGEFTITCRMPSSVGNNYRPATFSFYAASTDDADRRQAMGVLRNVYAFGVDENADEDSQAPIIHSAYLNDDGFKEGGKVNENPMLIATVSDDCGINISTSGIGRQMAVSLDGSKLFTDCSRYFTVDAVPQAGAMSGTLAYPLQNLSAGPHALTLRVWDVADNVAETTLEFNVVQGLKPQIYSVYTDAMPARSEANFYVKHNRPDALLTVRLSVYTLGGRKVWSSKSESRSNMNISEPIRWDLTDEGGKRVGRGIYLYRAEISTDGETFTTASRKIAVAADE